MAAKTTNKTTAPKTSKRADLLKSFGIESTNGRKGKVYGANKTGKENLAKIVKAIGTKKNVRIVPAYSKGTEEFTATQCPVKGMTDVKVPLTVAQVKRFGMEWANKNGRTAVDHEGCVLIK